MEQNMWGFAIIEVKVHQIHGYSSSYMSNPHCKTQFHLDLSDIDACFSFWTNRHHLARTRWRDFLWFFRMFVFWTCLKVDSFLGLESLGLAWLTVSFNPTFQPLACSSMMKQPWTVAKKWTKSGLNLLEHLQKVKWRYTIFWLWVQDIYNFCWWFTPPTTELGRPSAIHFKALLDVTRSGSLQEKKDGYNTLQLPTDSSFFINL